MTDDRIDLYLYDTQRELDRDAEEGRVCPLSALPVLSRQWVGESLPRGKPFPFPEKFLPALRAVLAHNGELDLPTQIACSLDLVTGIGPLLLAATWSELYLLLGGRDSPGAAWADRQMQLHYHGFTGPVTPRQMPLFAPQFPAQPYPLAALLKQALAARRRPLPRQPRPFSLDAFLVPGADGAPAGGPDGFPEVLRGWTLRSLLPDRGVFPDDRLWEAPLQYRYPAVWIIEERALLCTVAYTAFLGQKHPNWPDLLCRAIRDLPAGSCRWMLVPDASSPNPAESALAGDCLCFAVDDKARTITITRDDDARETFCQALESYNRAMKIPEDGFPF